MPHPKHPCPAWRFIALACAFCPLLVSPVVAIAESPAPVLVELVRVDDWLASLQSKEVTVQAAAASRPPSFTPEDLTALYTYLVTNRNNQLLSIIVHKQLLMISLNLDSSQRMAWVEAYRALESQLPPVEVSVPETQSLVEATLAAADAASTSPAPPHNPDQAYAAFAEIIRWLDVLIPDAEWRTLESAYAHAPLRPAVLEVWSRLQSPALRSFLETRLLSTDQEELLDLIPAYAAAFPDDHARMLLDLAKSTQYREVFWAALEILSTSGVLPSEVTAVRPDFTLEESQRFARYTLRAALALADTGQCAKAEPIFLDVVERNLSSNSVRASLQGLANCGYESLHRVSLGYINDPALRGIIIHLLTNHLDAATEKQLQANWANLPPLTQAALLQVFHARNAEAAAPLLKQAESSIHPAVRYQATLLSGSTPLEEDLWELVAAPPAWMQQEAARAYLALAKARIARGELADARRQYLALLQGGMPVAVELAAIEGLGKCGDPADKSILEELSGEQPLRVATQRALVELAGRSGSNEERAAAVGAMDTRKVPQEELDALVAGITDPEARAKVMLRAGFVAEGLVAGPFPQPEGTSVQQLHFPLLPYPLGGSVSYSGTDYPLQPLSACADGVGFDLNRCLALDTPGTTTSAYAVFELRLPALTGVHLHIHHHGGFAVWLNGKFQRTEPPVEDAKGAWYRLPAVLEPGLTYIVVKLPRAEQGWHAGLRVTLRDGKPLDLTRQAMPEDPLKPVGVESKNVKQLLDKLP